MTRPEGSVARQAFADARALLRSHELSRPAQRPAIDYVGVDRSADSTIVPAAARPAGEALPVEGEGPLLAARAALAEGSLTARALVEASLAAVEKRNEELGALVEVAADAALAEADRLDAAAAAGAPMGALHGIPITVKDVIHVAGMTTRAGSDAYEAHPTRDATAVARLRAAGAIILGKASTHEFALGVTSPKTRNPIDPTRLAGGSSGGSAAAIATGMGLASLGTDTRASIRVPAALCGVVGYKPTYGRIPVDGVVALSWTMDHVAPMAATVGDAALVLEVLAPECAGLGTHLRAGVDGLRIGVPPDAFAGAQPELIGAVEAAIEALGTIGASVVEVTHPDASDLDLASAAGLVVSRCEAAAAHRSLGLDRSRYWQEVADQLDEADRVDAVDYLDAQRVRLDLRDRLLGVFEHVELLAMPTALVTAPPLDDFARYLMVLARTAIPFSFVGFPALSVPCGEVDGLPVGLQLVAAPGREDRLVRAAGAVERLTRAAAIPAW